VDLQSGCLIDLELDEFVVTGLAVSVGSVLVGIHREVAVGEEREIEVQIAGGPVGHGADVPVIAVSPRYDDVFRNLAVESAGIVPDGRNRAEEFHGFGFAHVV